MKISRLLAALSAAAIAMAALPAIAEGEALPAACAGKSPILAEDEILVEHTLYLHGTTRVGTVDQVQEFAAADIGGKKFMDATAPSGSEYKVDPIVTGTNPNFNGNPNMAYWEGLFPDGEHIVCAGTTFFARAEGALTAKLFVDKAWADTPDGTQAAMATGTGDIKTWTADFGLMDVEVWDNIVLQIAPSAAGAVYYDAVEYQSTFTYVTVEAAPVSEVPTEEPTTAP